MKKQISRKSYGRTSMPEERRGARLLRTCLLSVALVAMVMREGLLMLDSHRGRLSTLSGQDFSSLPLQAILTGGNLTDSDEFPAKLDSKERLIALVHVGKAGGMTLRTSTALSCILFHANNAVKQEECLQKKFPEEKNTDNKLAYQTRVYFHIWGYRENEITNATSFLVMLRNPVDRVMSSYKYSHPENCNDNTRMHLPWGCEVAKDKKWNQTETHPAYELYRKCFPYASRLEDFAQATMSPWNPIKHFMETNMTMKDRWNCRKVARSALQGHTKGNTHPHMRYNYEYYARKSIWKFPGKEVFGIRTEHEWNDMVQLDKLLGGTGNFTNEAKSVSHGSEKYIPAPVSESAYHKLCCVLEREIEIYMDLLDSVENLSKQQKQESIDSVREKCGIADLSWTHWRMQCRSTIEADTLTLEKNLQG